MTVKRKAAVSPTLVSIVVPYAERLPAHRRTGWLLEDALVQSWVAGSSAAGWRGLHPPAQRHDGTRHGVPRGARLRGLISVRCSSVPFGQRRGDPRPPWSRSSSATASWL